MNSVIRDIINKKCSVDEKNVAFDSLMEDIELGRGILNGKFQYCPNCDDYYLSKSFLTESETKETKICIYEDPINSGGNEYVNGFVDITYSICPKGHKHELRKKERRK